jgi:hypothetical protein
MTNATQSPARGVDVTRADREAAKSLLGRDDMSEGSRDLDKALEAFASRVPYENEPDDAALAIKGGAANEAHR